jgi:hypothetical protein
MKMMTTLHRVLVEVLERLRGLSLALNDNKPARTGVVAAVLDH